MKIFVIVVLAGLAFIVPNSDCKKLHVGTFKIETPKGNYIITRTKDKQFEDVIASGRLCEFKIKWISSCSYMLYDRKVLRGKDDMPIGYKFDTLFCNITEVKGNMHKVFGKFKSYEGSECTLEKIK